MLVSSPSVITGIRFAELQEVWICRSTILLAKFSCAGVPIGVGTCSGVGASSDVGEILTL